MNVCKVPDMCKDMEYKYITEDSKTRVYLSVVREFNEKEYEEYSKKKKRAKIKKRIPEAYFSGILFFCMFCQNLFSFYFR